MQRLHFDGTPKPLQNVIDSLSAAWRIVSSIKQKDESWKNDDHVALVRDYRSKVERERERKGVEILGSRRSS
ncbi:hypothetical protein RJ639_020087 [Escallonia herrerae]|uniref:Uncharacterized protein n=1 Tax=Escallonia herrerae TaxID=1293975 RepID=A0AA88V7A8_9ASTE|nr:hypothetical protein RJ639_020087 [Escallonia herrerae]